MSEKRFERWNDYSCKVKDNQEDTFLNWEGVVNMLNEQQATINHLEKVNGKNFAKRRLLEQDNLVLRNENEQLRKQVKSSETTSDATSNYNAHLESKITTLEKENEQLQKELQRFKKYVFSQDNILCYKCEHCIKKDIYVVDCEMKGEVDVHGLCSLFREVKV